MYSFDALLLPKMILFVTRRHIHLLLQLGSAKAKFLPNSVSIAVGAEGLEFVLGPHFFVQALSPRLVLVVVAYHSQVPFTLDASFSFSLVGYFFLLTAFVFK